MKGKRSLAALLLAFVLWLCMVPAALADVKQYQADITVSDDGGVVVDERVVYAVDEAVDTFEHAIGANAGAKLTQLDITMRTVNQKQGFPFVEGSGKDVGTYNLERRGNLFAVTLHNHVERDDQEAFYHAEFSDAWTKYDMRQILEWTLFALPQALDGGTVSVHFPRAIDPKQFSYYIDPEVRVSAHWDDPQTLVFTAPKLEKDEKAAVILNAPADALKNNDNTGPHSKGEQIIRRINAANQQDQARYRWKRFALWAIFALMVALVLVYGWFLFRVKVRYRNETPSVGGRQWRYESPLQNVAVPGRLLYRLPSEQLLWALLFELVARENLAVEWETADDGSLIDAQFQIRNSEALPGPLRTLVTALERAATDDGVRFQSFKYGTSDQKHVSTHYRRALTAIQRAVNKVFDRYDIIDRRRTRRFTLGWWLVVLLLGAGTVAIGVLAALLGAFYWVLLLVLLLFILMVVLKRRALPIYTADGLSLRRYWRRYYKQLHNVAEREQPLQSWEIDYVYSWLDGSNQRHYQTLAEHGHSHRLALFEAIHDRELKHFK